MERARLQGLADTFRRSGILAGDQPAIDHDMGFPQPSVLKLRAPRFEAVFQQEGHDLGQADRFFFGIGKAADAFAVDQVAAIAQADVDQPSGAVADGADSAAAMGTKASLSGKSHMVPWPPT